MNIKKVTIYFLALSLVFTPSLSFVDAQNDVNNNFDESSGSEVVSVDNQNAVTVDRPSFFKRIIQGVKNFFSFSFLSKNKNTREDDPVLQQDVEENEESASNQNLNETTIVEDGEKKTDSNTGNSGNTNNESSNTSSGSGNNTTTSGQFMTLLSPKKGDVIDNTKEPIVITWDYSGFAPDTTFLIGVSRYDKSPDGSEGYDPCVNPNKARIGDKKFVIPANHICTDGDPLYIGDYRIIVDHEFGSKSGSFEEAGPFSVSKNIFGIRGLISRLTFSSADTTTGQDFGPVLVEFKTDNQALFETLKNWYEWYPQDPLFTANILDSNGSVVCRTSSGPGEGTVRVMVSNCSDGTDLPEGDYQVSLHESFYSSNVVGVQPKKIQSPIIHYTPIGQ